MTKHEHEIDRQMREKFDTFRPDVSPGLWEKIAAGLDGQDKPVVAMPRARKRRTGWWMSAAAVLLLGLFAWWLYQPAEVVYLQGPAVAAADTAEAPATPEPVPVETVEARVEPLNLAPIRALFAERPRRTARNAEEIAPQEESQEEVTQVSVPVVDVPATTHQMVAAIPEVQEPIVTETVESGPVVEELYAVVSEIPDNSAVKPIGEKPFGVSSILNLVVGSVDPRADKLITFSNDDEGLIKMDFNLGRKRN